MEYLLFSHRGLLFAVPADGVMEILWLPALTPVEGSLPYLAGVLNLRGALVPVIQLDLVFGHENLGYALSDQVLVFRKADRWLGVISNAVHRVEYIGAESIEDPPTCARRPSGDSGVLIRSLAKTGVEIAMILDVDRLFQPLDLLHDENTALEPDPDQSTPQDQNQSPSPLPVFWPLATPEDRAVLIRRAEEYAQRALEPYDFGQAVAIARLSGELFAVPLETVREFADVQAITPIPRAPVFVAGAMNLRGEILTLLDISGLFQLPALSTRPAMVGLKAAVTALDDAVVGIVFDDILAISYVKADEVAPVAQTMSARSKPYVSGFISFEGKSGSLLDLPSLLSQAWLAE